MIPGNDHNHHGPQERVQGGRGGGLKGHTSNVNTKLFYQRMNLNYRVDQSQQAIKLAILLIGVTRESGPQKLRHTHVITTSNLSSGACLVQLLQRQRSHKINLGDFQALNYLPLQ